MSVLKKILQEHSGGCIGTAVHYENVREAVLVLRYCWNMRTGEADLGQ